MVIWVVSVFWLLWMILQWIWECRYLFKILIFILLYAHPGMRLPDHSVALFFKFRSAFIRFEMYEGASKRFSTVVHHFTFPPTVSKGSDFSTLQPTLTFYFLHNHHPNEGEVTPHGGFGLHFPDDCWCWESLIYLLVIRMSSLEKCLPMAKFLSCLETHVKW